MTAVQIKSSDLIVGLVVALQRVGSVATASAIRLFASMIENMLARFAVKRINGRGKKSIERRRVQARR